MSWLIENLATIIIGLIILGIVAMVVRGIRKDHKAGKSCSCGSSCGGCTGCGTSMGK
jgi:hypothetical protein